MEVVREGWRHGGIVREGWETWRYSKGGVGNMEVVREGWETWR